MARCNMVNWPVRIRAWLFCWECTYLSEQRPCRSEHIVPTDKNTPFHFCSFCGSILDPSCFCSVLAVNLFETFTDLWRPFHPCGHGVKWEHFWFQILSQCLQKEGWFLPWIGLFHNKRQSITCVHCLLIYGYQDNAELSAYFVTWLVFVKWYPVCN